MSIESLFQSMRPMFEHIESSYKITYQDVNEFIVELNNELSKTNTLFLFMSVLAHGKTDIDSISPVTNIGNEFYSGVDIPTISQLPKDIRTATKADFNNDYRVVYMLYSAVRVWKLINTHLVGTTFVDPKPTIAQICFLTRQDVSHRSEGGEDTLAKLFTTDKFELPICKDAEMLLNVANTEDHIAQELLNKIGEALANGIDVDMNDVEGHINDVTAIVTDVLDGYIMSHGFTFYATYREIALGCILFMAFTIRKFIINGKLVPISNPNAPYFIPPFTADMVTDTIKKSMRHTDSEDTNDNEWED